MKKFLKSILILILTISCGLVSIKKDNNIYGRYNLEAKIITTKGDINMYLYPKAAPETVANFVFLAENGFYNALNFHRVEPLLIQGGDPNYNGTGGPGYFIKDEFDSFLKFTFPGMVAMANAGENTSGSQFFITKVPIPILNGRYSIFGSLKSKEDLVIVKAIEKGDEIKDIVIIGDNKEEFLKLFEDKISLWNKILEER